jgi:hypothetical protein
MKWWPIGLLAAAAAASALNVAALTFEHLLDPRWGAKPSACRRFR